MKKLGLVLNTGSLGFLTRTLSKDEVVLVDSVIFEAFEC